MPIPFLDSVTGKDYFWERCDWQYKLVLWPRRCWITKQWIWLTRAHCAVRTITGPGEPIFEYRWVAKEQFIIQRLKGVL